MPNASTVGRNTLETGGTNNFDLSVFKSFAMGERKRLEFRWEALNAFNHPRFIEVPERHVLGAPPGAVLESRFHQQRHPQHVGAGKAGLLSGPCVLNQSSLDNPRRPV
jgi:hypothetical protein